jgi:hypothetical protein
MRIFKATHSDYTFEKGTSFNIKLLETMVLINMTSYAGEVDSSVVPAILIPGNMKQQWRNDYSQVLYDRNCWLQHREDLVQSRSDGQHLETQIRVEEFTSSTWSAFQNAIVAGNSHSMLLSVLHRFMALSAEISRIVRDDRGDEISDKWIDLALETMLQSALSLLSPSNNDTPLEPVLNTNGHTPPKPGLKDCFAFGFLPSLSSATFSETDLLINDMFASTDPDSNALIENPSWTTARANFLAEFRLPTSPSTPGPSQPSASINPGPFLARLAKLRHKYPFPAFRRNLFRCLEHFFIINMNVRGKPVLVQIEDGELGELNEGEFEGFLARVGLLRDESGKIDFGFGVGQATAMNGDRGADGAQVGGRYGEMGSLSETFRRKGGRGKA